MILIDNILYAGITEKTDLDCPTGYSIIRVTDGVNLGKQYELKEEENPKIFFEIDDDNEANYKNYFLKGNSIYAGITTEAGAEAYDLGIVTYTGKKFIRIHDGMDMGSKIVLGIDYSYNKDNPRIDLPKYYLEVEDKGE